MTAEDTHLVRNDTSVEDISNIEKNTILTKFYPLIRKRHAIKLHQVKLHEVKLHKVELHKVKLHKARLHKA